jgi:hypothetical protein
MVSQLEDDDDYYYAAARMGHILNALLPLATLS